jgi:hypothetical protein
MINQRDEGLGLSLGVYVGAMLLGLGAIVGPMLWTYGGTTEYENPALPSYDITSSKPLFSQQRQIPLARLTRQEIVDPAMLAALNARTTKTAKVHERTAPTHTARTAYAQAPEADERPERRRPRFFFGLF